MRFVIVCLLLVANLFAISNSTKIGIIKVKLVEARKQGNYAQMINLINQWKAIDKRGLPQGMIYWEGKALYATNEYLKSFRLMEKYMEKAGTHGKYYKEAVGYYTKIEPMYDRLIKEEKLEKAYQNRVVVDKKRKLMWQNTYDIVKVYVRSIDEARGYCSNLRLKGYSDWRVPAPKEIITIADFTKKLTIKDEFVLAKMPFVHPRKRYILNKNYKRYIYDHRIYEKFISAGTMYAYVFYPNLQTAPILQTLPDGYFSVICVRDMNKERR